MANIDRLIELLEYNTPGGMSASNTSAQKALVGKVFKVPELLNAIADWSVKWGANVGKVMPVKENCIRVAIKNTNGYDEKYVLKDLIASTKKVGFGQVTTIPARAPIQGQDPGSKAFDLTFSVGTTQATANIIRRDGGIQTQDQVKG